MVFFGMFFCVLVSGNTVPVIVAPLMEKSCLKQASGYDLTMRSQMWRSGNGCSSQGIRILCTLAPPPQNTVQAKDREIACIYVESVCYNCFLY
jgi:hypothetical protein